MSVSVLQPESMVLEALPPPTPRRQSCDRCHEQKVRCSTDGGQIEESEASLGKSVEATVPCQRCEKAGTVCIYSPQLPSGRPRIHQRSGRKNRRKYRKSSKCWYESSSPSVSPTMMQAPVTPFVPPAANTPHYDHGSQDGPDVGTPLELMQHFGSDDNLFSPAMGPGAAAFPQSPDIPALHSLSLHTNSTSQGSTIGMLHGVVDQPWMRSQQANTPMEEILQLNLRIHQAGLLLSLIAKTLQSLPSSELNEVFAATCAFINFVEQNTARQASSPHTPVVEYGAEPHAHPNFTPANISPPLRCESIALRNATDTSVCLMVFACHQLLLGIFEDFCDALSLHVKSQHLPSNQVLVTVSFIHDLLAKLDQAIGLLAAIAGYRRASELSTPNTPFSDYHHSIFGSSTDFSSSLGSPVLTGQNPRPQITEKGKAFCTVFNQAEKRQARVTEQVVGLRRLLDRTPLL